MTSILLTVNGAEAQASVSGTLTSGMVGVPVTIEYDETWEGLTKNLVCRCSEWYLESGEQRTILNVGNTAVVAHEVMQAGKYLYLGLEGYSPDGNLVIPTTWARSEFQIQSGANADADPSIEPTLPVWEQLQTEIEQVRQDAVTSQEMTDILSGIQSAAQAAAIYAGRAETAAKRAEEAANSESGAGGGSEEEVEDILLGTLPMTISESNCYLLSETNATISTGEGTAQLLDFDLYEPKIGDITYNGGACEVLGKNTIKMSFANVAKNASATVAVPFGTEKTYTIAARLVGKSSDIASNKPPKITANNGTSSLAQLTLNNSDVMQFKTFIAEASGIQITLATASSYVVGETYVTIEVYIYEGEYTEIPSGTTFDILAGEKYGTDGYIGATLSAVTGGPVQVYQVNTAGAEAETDNGGVIFFGDSILHYSDVVGRYAAKTGKPILSCAVGGTRMSASRDSSNAYYPLDMANIADAIASGDFSAQLGSSVATGGFTTLASANIANYKAIVLEFGTNDFSAKVPFEGDDATSIAGAVRHILRTILTKYPNMRIVVLSTLQYVTLGTGTESGVPTHDDGTVWQMNEVIRDVCESDEFCVPWVDMYHAFGQNGITRNTLNSDGVHLTSPNGAKRYADILVGQLNALGI